jgi:hypothetical protein
MNRRDQDIEELLNSFIDGELTPEQRAEVERLVAGDEQIARRLHDLQKCKILMEALPRAEAPAGTLERIQASLHEESVPGTRVGPSDERREKRLFVDRRVLAVAAMVAVMAALAVVIYTVSTPEAGPQPQTPIGPPPTVAVMPGFDGRLELSAGAFTEVVAFISKAIDESGLSACVDVRILKDKNVYALSCDKEDLNVLLGDLAGVWDRFTSATLFVQTEPFGSQVAVHAVTAEQIGKVVNQESREMGIEVAKDLAVLNNMAKLTPGHEILAVLDEKKPSLPVPKAFLTSGQPTPRQAPRPKPDEQQVRLTIVVKAGT